MKTAAAFLLCAQVAVASGPYQSPYVLSYGGYRASCASSYCAPTATYATPYVAPVAKPVYNTTSTYNTSYNYPPPIIIPVGIPVNPAPLLRQGGSYFSYGNPAGTYPYTDLAAPLQQAGKLGELMISSANEGRDNFLQMIQQVKETDAGVARAAFTERALARAFEDAKTTTQTTVTYQGRQQSSGFPLAARGTLSTREAVIANRCVACHPTFNKPTWADYEPDLQKSIKRRIRTHDEAKLMPRDPADKTRPGVPLSDAELDLFDE